MRERARPALQALRHVIHVAARHACAAFGLFILCSALFSAASPRPAQAACINCGCIALLQAATNAEISVQYQATRLYIQQQFESSRSDFYSGFLFSENIVPALQGMTEQLVSASWIETMAIGAMLDAKEQLETQQLLQRLSARAHKEYQTDTEVCAVATASQALGSSYYNGRLASHTLSKRMQDRELGQGFTLGGGGSGTDKLSRFNQIRSTFCSPHDHANGMEVICNATEAAKINADINFTTTVLNSHTLQANFTDGAANLQEPEIFAMAANLYGNTTFPFISQQIFRNEANHAYYLDIREIAAKRNVAELSFSNLIGMKTAGLPVAEPTGLFVRKVYEQLGMQPADAEEFFKSPPSYWALMEVMNKTLYERPDFYINLYTTPANIDRIGATIRAANLMQDMDTFKGQLRSEMALSQILESEVTQLQDNVQNDFNNRIRATGAVRRAN